MGNSQNKQMSSFLHYISENNIKNADQCNELLNLKEDFKNDGDFNDIYKNVKSMNNITSLFEFLIHTFNKCILDANEKNVSECRICLNILLCIFPCIQYNYKKKDVIRLLFEKDYFNFTTYGLRYTCDNILILHVFNLLLIMLFTENICINKCSNETLKEPQHEFIKNTVDAQKLWRRHISFYNKEKQMGEEKLMSPLKNDKNFSMSNVVKENDIKEEINKQNKSDFDKRVEKGEEISNETTKGYRRNTIYDENSDFDQKEENDFQNNSIDLELIKNRIIILKCLLILLSTYIYYDPSNYLQENNLFLFFFTSGEICYTSNFFLSLINVIYDNEFNYFNSFYFNDLYIEYYNLCILILNILIDFNPILLKEGKKIHYMDKSIKHFYKFGKKRTTKNATTDNGNINIENKETSETLNEGDLSNGKNNVNDMNKTDVNLPVDNKCNTTNQMLTPGFYSSFPSNSSFKTVTCIDTSEKTSSSSASEKSENENNTERVIVNKSNESREEIKTGFSENDKSGKEDSGILQEKDEIGEYFCCNNVFFHMFQELGLDSMKYIYSGILNMLISFKMYSETYDENLPFLENYILLLWNLIDHNSNFIKYLKTHNSNIFLYYIFYVLLFFNNWRKIEIQRCSMIKKEKNATLQVFKGDTHKRINEETDEEDEEEEEEGEVVDGDVDVEDEYFFDNEEFLKSNKCDEFGVRKIDGLIYICLFIMIKISSKRTICKKLNEPCVQNAKRKIMFLKHINDFNTYADFFIYTFCTLINDNIYFLKFERIVDMSLTILTNISVHIKSMGVVSCDCIIAVLKKILKKEWVLSSEHHFYSLFLLLDFINNILSYNLCENYNLVYTIIKNKNVFFSIHNLNDTLKSSFYPDTYFSNVYWVPTEKWLLNWKNKLPLEFINSIIHDLADRVEEECDKKEILDYDEVVNVIKNHCNIIVKKKIPFVIRKCDKNISLSKWFTNYLYFLVFFHFYKQNLFINNGVTFIF